MFRRYVEEERVDLHLGHGGVLQAGLRTGTTQFEQTNGRVVQYKLKYKRCFCQPRPRT